MASSISEFDQGLTKPAFPLKLDQLQSSTTLNSTAMNRKFPLVDNMRLLGGNFVSKLAEAMVAADPVNFDRLCAAFPEIVEKYSESTND